MILYSFLEVKVESVSAVQRDDLSGCLHHSFIVANTSHIVLNATECKTKICALGKE